jgi:NADH-quinone oxidoreductase subunit G
VRFSQEIAEDYQLIFTERGAHTIVGTHDGHPYVAPFSGNIIELCPVGALTSQPYRFRARPWDIEGSAGICTLCSSQCNVTFTVRDERVMRVLSREFNGNEDVDDGWLCDKGRFAYQAIHVDDRITRPLVRDGGELREVSWERALETAAGLARHQGRVGTLVGGQATNEEGFLLQRLSREALESADIDSRGCGPTRGSLPIPADLARALAAPELGATVPDIEFAHTVLLFGCDPRDDSPILDLRIRKGVRRNGVQLAIATARPTALEANAATSIRYAPGADAQFAAALESALDGATDVVEDVAALATLLRDGGEDVVIIFGERIGAAAAAALARIAIRIGVTGHRGAGLLALPAGANGRGLREAGAVPDAGPGYRTLEATGRSSAEIAAAAADGEITALHLFGTDPVRDEPDRALWERALHSAALVVAHASVLTEGLAEHATVIFPAESHAEKEGTLVHPDGRLQRMRIAIAHPGEVRPGWWVLTEIASACGLDTGVERAGDAFAQLVAAVPFYEGLTLEEIGGHGVRWPARPQAASLAAGDGGLDTDPAPAGAQSSDSESAALTNGHLRLGTYRPIWAAPECEISPALKFLIPEQQVELSPGDAERLGILHGEDVVVTQNGTRLNAKAFVRSAVPAGSAFLAEGLAAQSANVLTESLIEVIKP